MGLDIKLPIGAMFTIFGILLTIFGLSTGENQMYEASLNININLWSGLSMLIFGLAMLIAAYKTRKKNS